MATFRSFIGSELLAIKQHLAAVKSIIPDKVKLLPSERRSLFKLHLKRKDFAFKAINLMRRSPSTAPSFVDIQSCNNYMQLYEQYTEILEEVEAVKRQLRAHFEAGANHVCIQPVHAEGDIAARDAMVAALADT